ncbi:MAG: NAD-dependent protein deacylase [Candidatus Methanoplasma sp.]|jgi:NAD-dependent deacetylase|nr:NAD-dependent protein deacylase [Candidatus Methanoplasma sp.]
MDGQIAALRAIVNDSDNVVFFGGAGVSTESGIPDFRSTDGLYSKKYEYPPESMLSHTFFMENTAEFYRFYRDKMVYPDAKPNAAHLKLAELESRGKVRAVVTQNIDGLHQSAGSRCVRELHGSVHRNFCMRCGTAFSLDHILKIEGVPRCGCGGIVKPDVVLYEEPLNRDTTERAVAAIRDADVLIVGGTSLNVYPAAGLLRYYRGGKLVLMNRSELPHERDAMLTIRGSIGEVLSKV